MPDTSQRSNRISNLGVQKNFIPLQRTCIAEQSAKGL
jgi:hypothetical protein